jgi:drug/metabolite transporter (DMT)-like permease
MPLPNAYAIYLSTPLMVTALAVLFLGDKVAWRRWSAIGAGAIGVLLVIQPLGTAFNWFSVAALVGTLFGAIRDVMTRGIAREIPSLLVTVATMVAILLTAGGSVLVTGWTPVVPSDLLLLSIAALFLTGGYMMLVIAMRVAETSLVAPFLYTAILWALLIGYFVWGDVPNLMAGVGILILVGSGLYLMHRERIARAERHT